MPKPLSITVLMVALAAPAYAASFTDYRIPDHHGFRWSADFMGEALRAYSNRAPVASRQGGARGRLAGVTDWFQDSDRLQRGLRATLNADGVRQSFEHDRYEEYLAGGAASTHTLDRDRWLNEAWSLSASGRWYPGARPVGLSGSITAGGRYFQRWSSELRQDQSTPTGSTLRSETSRNSREDRYATTVDADLQPGWGRVRDATPAFDALVLEERLARDGVLARPLSPAGRARLAQLVSVAPRFKSVHDQSLKAFWREVERVLREDGALGDAGLDAHAAFHAAEPLQVAGSFPRQVGWFAGPLFSLRHAHEIRRTYVDQRFRLLTDGVVTSEGDGSSSTRGTSDLDRVQFGLGAEFHRALGDRTQLDASERWSVDRRGSDHGTSGYGQLLLRHLVAERWLFWGEASHARWLEKEPDEWSRWDVTARAGLAWYLEDRLSLSLAVSDSRVHESPGGTEPASRTAGWSGVTLGLSYGRGRLDAPGLLPPIRPLN